MAESLNANSKSVTGKTGVPYNPHDALVKFAKSNFNSIHQKFGKAVDSAYVKMEGGERLSRAEWLNVLSLEYLLVRANKRLQTDQVALNVPVLPGKSGGVTASTDKVIIRDTQTVRLNCTQQEFESAKKDLLKGAPAGVADALEYIRSIRAGYDEALLGDCNKSVRVFVNKLDDERRELEKLSSVGKGDMVRQAALESLFHNVQRGMYDIGSQCYTFELPVIHEFNMGEVKRHAETMRKELGSRQAQ